MAYNFLAVSVPNIRKRLHEVFGTASGHDHDGTNSKKAITWHTKIIKVEDLAAGVDIADRIEMVVPTGQTWLITDSKIISNGTASGIDDSNKSTVVLKNGTNAVFSKEFNTATTFPAAGASTSPTLDGDYTSVAAGSSVKLSVTNGSTADTPAFSVQVTMKITVA